MTSCAHPPTHAPTEGPITQARDAAEYLRRHNINGLLSGMMAGLMMALPEDHVDYMQQAVSSARDMGLENVDWQTFVQALHPYKDPLRRKLFHPPVPVDGGNLPVGVIERRDFILSLTDEETIRRPPLPFWHIDYFTQPQLDDPEFFLVPDWPMPDDSGPPEDVLGMRESAAVVLRPERLCPSPPPEKVDDKVSSGTSLTKSSLSQKRSGEQGSENVEDKVTSGTSLTQSSSLSQKRSGEQGPRAAEDPNASQSTVILSPSPSPLSDTLR